MILFLFSCAPSFLPQELLFSITDIHFSPYEPAIYLVSSIDTEEEDVWEAQQQHFVFHHYGDTSFYGSISLYMLPIPWDQNTLPPYGNVVYTQDIQLIQDQPIIITMDTPKFQGQQELHSFIYVEGEGELFGDIEMKPTIWAHPSKRDLWTYSVLSYRY